MLSPFRPPEGKASSNGRVNGTDVERFSRFLDGDDQGLVELFDLHNHRLFLYCLGIVHDARRAEDATQEMWRKVIELRGNGKATPDNPLGLFLRIARNLCLDDLRKQRNHAVLEELPERYHPMEEIPELSHMEELVILAMRRLPVAQREVLALNAYSGYRFDEIAEMLDEPVGAVRTRAWRARIHLGRIISAHLGVNEDVEKETSAETLQTGTK